jgi:hypothetical protein
MEESGSQGGGKLNDNIRTVNEISFPVVSPFRGAINVASA